MDTSRPRYPHMLLVLVKLGLFTIGAGFILLHFVTTSAHANWMTLLPGCIVAGIGLGFTNTPVTNTATAAVPPERAGMASGMDMSARFISLSPVLLRASSSARKAGAKGALAWWLTRMRGPEKSASTPSMPSSEVPDIRPMYRSDMA